MGKLTFHPIHQLISCIPSFPVLYAIARIANGRDKTMTARNDVLLTLAQVDAWQKEKDALERDIREKSENLRKIKIKLEAAEIFAVESSSPPSATNGHAEPASVIW
jgi:hypothetical protein